MGIVVKVGTVDVSDDLEFVLSDATPDRYGDVVEARGWDLSWFKQNPIALFGHDNAFPIGTWENVRVDNDRLVGRLKLAAPGTSARIDELRSLVEQKILRAVSVGFKPIESESNGKRGIRFLKQELLETSLVSVPANPAALAVARSMNLSDDTMRLAFGEHAEGGRGEGVVATGEKAAPPTQKTARTPIMKTLSQRIEDAQADLLREKDALTVHLSEDEADPIVTDELSARIEQKTASVEALKRAEAALAIKTASPMASVPAAAARRPMGASQKATGDLIIRAAVVNGIAAHMHQDPLDVMERLYGQDEGVAMIVKAAVAPATTTTAGWAAELINTAMSDFLETLRPTSVYPSLSEAGGGRLTFGPNSGAIKIPARSATPSIGGSFIGEGAAIPVRRLALTSVTLSPKKMGVITTFTREMAKYSIVSLESMLRQEILYDTSITLDSVLLGAAAGSETVPAGLLNGVTAITATTGGGAAAILGDIKKLRAPFDAANAGGDLMLLMNPAQAESLNLTPGADGTLGWAAGIISRYRVAVSTAIPAGRVIMVRAADFASATGDVPEFELSNDATVHMEDTTPLAISTTGTPNVVAAPVRSFFQTGVSGLRMIMDVSWVMRRPGSVQFINDVSW